MRNTVHMTFSYGFEYKSTNLYKSSNIFVSLNFTKKVSTFSVLLNRSEFSETLCEIQGWEFAHQFSGQIARFLPKNERTSDSLKKTSDSLIRSFLVSDLSDSLTITHFL